MNRREFLMTTLAAFALSALPKLTFAETIPVSDAVKHKIDPKNKLGFGFMRLPLKNPEDQTSIDYAALNQMVDLFLQRGFTYFDTAWMYMGYESEVALRKSLVERHPRNKFTVASKLPIGYLKSKEEQEQIFNKQLEKPDWITSTIIWFTTSMPTPSAMPADMTASNLSPTRKRKAKSNISVFLFMTHRNFWKKC